MRFWQPFIVVAIAVLVLAQSALAAGDIEFGRYHALVIGNNDYQNLPKLETAVADAEAVARQLEQRYGFTVTKRINATRTDIIAALNALRRDLTEQDNLLIYYAGHGFLDESGTGYWLPVDAEKDSDTYWIANAALTRRLKLITARHVLVVADSCYAGTLLREAPAELPIGAERRAWLERMNELRSRTALVSGSIEPVIDSGGGGHSVFARAFLDALEANTDVLEGRALYDRISRPVILNARQTPQYSDIRLADHEGGEFMFVPLNVNVDVAVTVEQPAAPPATVQADREVVFWQSIQSSTNPAMFEAYLRRYPDGEFADIAKLKIEAAQEKQAALAVPTEPAEATDPTADLRAAEVALDLSREERRLVQRALNDQGHEAGAVDGLFGRGTRSAIASWQVAGGAEGTGYLNVAQAKALIKAASALAPPPKPTAPSATRPAVGTYPMFLQAQ